MGVLAATVVAAADALRQNLWDGVDLTRWTVAGLQAAAALEAPLTVCEDFVVVALLLVALAASSSSGKGRVRLPVKRVGCLLAVGVLCVVVEVVLFARFGGLQAEYLTFSRVFVFECPPALAGLVGFYAVMLGLVGLGRRTAQPIRPQGSGKVPGLGPSRGIFDRACSLRFQCQGGNAGKKEISSLSADG